MIDGHIARRALGRAIIPLETPKRWRDAFDAPDISIFINSAPPRLQRSVAADLMPLRPHDCH